MLQILLRSLVPLYQKILDLKFILAATLGKSEEVKSLLEQGANVNGIWGGRTALHLVAMLKACDVVEPKKMGLLPNDFEITQLLLSRGANSSLCDQNNEVPVHYAVRDKKLHLLPLLANESNINIQGLEGYTALHLAVELAQLESIKVFADIDTTDWNLPDDLDRTPLNIALSKSWTHALNGDSQKFEAYQPIVKLLLERSDINLVMPMLSEWQSYLRLSLNMLSGLVVLGAITEGQEKIMSSGLAIINEMIDKIYYKSIIVSKDIARDYNNSSDGIMSITRWQEAEDKYVTDGNALPVASEVLGETSLQHNYGKVIMGGLHGTSPFLAS